MTEKEYLKHCLNEVKTTLFYEDDVLVTSSYSRLSQEIYNKTKERISDRTLRKLFDYINSGESGYDPYLATKDTLAKYLGYDDWNSYRKSFKPYYKLLDKKLLIRAGILLSGLLLLAGITYMVWPKQKSPDFHFEGTNLNGDHTPHTIFIRYANEKIKKRDTLYVHFGEEDGDFVPLSREDSVVSHCYGDPWYYIIRLKYNDKIIHKMNAMIQTNGWLAQYIPAEVKFLNDGRKTQIYDAYPPSDLPIRSSYEDKLGLSRKDLVKKNFDTNKLYFTMYKMVDSFCVKLDDMDYFTRFRNGPKDGGISCYNVDLVLQGQKSAISFSFIGEGCEEFAEIHLDNLHLHGKTSDLSFLSIDLSKFKDIHVRIHQSKVMLFINQSKVFDYNYDSTLGKLRGIAYKFRGSGVIKKSKIIDGTDTLSLYP